MRLLSSPLRILHVTAPARTGGLESVVRLLAKGQQAAGHRVTVAAVVGTEEGDHPFVSALSADRIESLAIRLGAKSYVREWRRIRAVCVASKPDIVHTHGYRSDVIAGLAAGASHAKRVTTVHGFTGGDLKNRLNEWAQVRSYRRFDAVVSVSGAIASRLTESGVRDKLIHTIPNAIDQRRKLESRFDARRRLGLADEEFVIGWVGRMSHEKGLDVLIDALATIGKPFKAIFVGDGPDRTLLQGRARAVGADSSIVWAGVLPDAASIFAAFDTFVLSSRTEGIPIVLLEAMRASVPIVSTRVGGVPEMLGENEAFLVETSRPDLVAAAIDTVAREPANALSRATMARARLERDFTVEPWVDRYDAVYRAVLGRSGVGER